MPQKRPFAHKSKVFSSTVPLKFSVAQCNGRGNVNFFAADRFMVFVAEYMHGKFRRFHGRSDNAVAADRVDDPS